MKRGKKWSSVWDCFKQEGNFVRCRKCDAVLKYCGGATTTMMYHIGRYHNSAAPEELDKPTVSETRCVREESVVQVVATESLRVPSANSELLCMDTGGRKRPRRSSVWEIFVRVDNEAHCTLCDTKLKYMSSTSNMMQHIRNKHPPLEEDKHEVAHSEVTRLVCRMIEKEMLPVSIVDGDSLRELLTYIVRNYKMPSAEDVSRHIEGHFREKTYDLKSQLATVQTLAVTANCWTAHPSERYVTFTCHFFTSAWEVRSAVLKTHCTSAGDTNKDSFTERLTETVEAWGISGRVIACVHNNARNVLRTCARVTWDTVVCFATTLHFAVSDGLTDNLLNVVVAAGELVKHFNDSSLASKALEMKQAQMQLPKHKLIQSSKARWDTICDMFERLVEQRWAIKAVLSDRMVTNREEAQAVEMEDDYWQTIEDITPVLATLKWATLAVTAEKEVSISNIYPITFSLLQTHLTPKQHDAKQVCDFKFKVRESLRERMEVDSSDLASKPALIASMLDPRHKHLSFLTPTTRLAAKVKLHEMASKLAVETTIVGTKTEKQETSVTPPVSQGAMSRQKGGGVKHAMTLLLGENYSSYSNDSEAQVDYYLRDISPSLDINPLDWWRVNGSRFPSLEILARQYLCIPGISVPSNQVFSDVGQKFARMCTRMSPEHVDMMMFLNKNVWLG